MKILFKYPTMARPDWFKETLTTYIEMLSGKNEYKFLISLNEDDETMNCEEMINFLRGVNKLFSSKQNISMQVELGFHKNKVAAINAGMIGEKFDILFLISDDMIPIVKDFDLIISEAMQKHFPDLDGALHFNDGFLGKDKTITLSILGRKLYEHFGYIYHPDYKSFFCDAEFTEEVYRMKKVIYFDQVIVKHEWSGGPRSDDALYRHNSKLGRPDKATYDRRKKLGFPKESVL